LSGLCRGQQIAKFLAEAFGALSALRGQRRHPCARLRESVERLLRGRERGKALHALAQVGELGVDRDLLLLCIRLVRFAIRRAGLFLRQQAPDGLGLSLRGSRYGQPVLRQRHDSPFRRPAHLVNRAADALITWQEPANLSSAPTG
jgi:hypothetical protein